MTSVSILAVPTENGDLCYCGVAGDKRSRGRTAGEALDALAEQLSADEASTLVVVQSPRPDRLFDAAQQERLAELMGRWRTARDTGESLPDDQQLELEALVEVELNAAAERAAALSNQLSR